jgi:HPr kinase/phosphorylase
MFSVTLRELVDEFQLEVVTEHDRIDDILVTTSDVLRPGLQLVGYFEHFDSDRIQILGNVEIAYLAGLSSEERYKRLDDLFGIGFPCMVIARSLSFFPEMVDVSKKYVSHTNFIRCDFKFCERFDKVSECSAGS